jgi:hypothetical protein
MALLKPPGGGREKPWHQDKAYFNLTLDTPVVGTVLQLRHISHMFHERRSNCCTLVGQKSLLTRNPTGSILAYDGGP